MKEFIEALRENRGYDWIANNDWKLSKEELITIIKEYDYATQKYNEDYRYTYSNIADELEEQLEE